MKHRSRGRFHLQDLSISSKFGVSFLIIVILPLLCLFLWINSSVSRSIREQRKQTTLEVLKQTGPAVDNMLQDVNYVSIENIGNTELQKYLEQKQQEKDNGGQSSQGSGGQSGQDSTSTRGAQEALRASISYELTALMQSRKYISHAAVFDSRNVYFQTGSYLEQEDTTGLEEAAKLGGEGKWYPSARNEKYAFSDDSIQEVSFVRAINNFNRMNDILAYERINIPESALCQLYNSVSDENTLEMLILNEDGDVVSATDKTRLGQNLRQNPLFQKIRDSREGCFDLPGKKTVTFYRNDTAGWYVIKADRDVAFTGSGLVNSVILICSCLVGVFGIFFFLMQRREIIRPITELSEEVRHFHEGNYDIRLHANGRDEIGELNRGFVAMSDYIRNLIESVYKSQLKEKEAQLMYLQSQINPHFLYNTLDSMRWMALGQQQTELAAQIEALANLFRHALNQGRDMTTVGEEVQYLKDYLLIEKNRFGDRISVTLQYDEKLADRAVMNLLLQPLVENAFVHGLEGKLGGGNIDIRIEEKDGMLHYAVRDNGLGTDQEAIRRKLEGKEENTSGNALALDNINRRIRLKYGEPYGVTFTSSIGAGTLVEIWIPDREGENSK